MTIQIMFRVRRKTGRLEILSLLLNETQIVLPLTLVISI